jgi:prepilin-type N-terminal cleavage/methylation domain-containing protein
MLSEQMEAHRRPSPEARRRGFTTIELLIVIVIAGVTAVAAMPMIGRTVANERARRGSTEISNFLEYGFAVAARIDKPVALSYTSSSGLLTLTDRVTSTTLRQMLLKQGSTYQFQTVTFSPNSSVTIFPSGLSSSAITITVAGMTNALTRTITASQAGQIRIQ